MEFFMRAFSVIAENAYRFLHFSCMKRMGKIRYVQCCKRLKNLKKENREKASF